MTFDKIFYLTGGVYFNFYNICIYTRSTFDLSHSFPWIFFHSRVTGACPVTTKFDYASGRENNHLRLSTCTAVECSLLSCVNENTFLLPVFGEISSYWREWPSLGGETWEYPPYDSLGLRRNLNPNPNNTRYSGYLDLRAPRKKEFGALKAVEWAGPAYAKSYILPDTDKTNVRLRALVSVCHGALFNRVTRCNRKLKATYTNKRNQKSKTLKTTGTRSYNRQRMPHIV